MNSTPSSFYCVQKIPEFEKLAASLGFTKANVVTSRDLDLNAKKQLSSRHLSDNSIIDSQFSDHLPRSGAITKWAIPFVFGEGSAIFIVTAEPHSEVAIHSHNKGFVRTVSMGELTITGLPNGEITLTSGEWIFIPSGQNYGYRVGENQYVGNCCYCIPK